MYRAGKGNLITPVAVTTKAPTQYPSKWFSDHPGTKPTLTLSLTCQDLETVRGRIKNQIQNNQLKLNQVTTFLYYYFNSIEETLDEDWKSYGVTIGVKDQKINVFSLVNPQIGVVPVESETTPATNSDDHWMAICVLGIYRLVRARVQDYRATLATRITEQMTAAGAQVEKATEVVDAYAGWANDRGYTTIVACVDMFFNKFPDHSLANVRIGTMGTRYKDCAALLSYGYILEYLGMSMVTEFMDWVFVAKVGDEIDTMMKNDEELTDSYSYFPYQIDLGLVKKSNYSATSNPHFFELVHLVGCILRSQRSINARHISDSQAMNLLVNAGCIAYVYSHYFNLEKVYWSAANAGAPDRYDDDNLQGEEFLDTHEVVLEAMKSKDPMVWIDMLRGLGNQIPAPIRNFLKASGRQIKDPREGTMEAHLKSIIQAL